MRNTNTKTKALTICYIAIFTALTAILSQISIPLPFTPVPINLATLSVFLCGGLLGATYGGASQLVYCLLGAVGIPVFANFTGGLGILSGPTGGYIIGYIVAAFVIGLLKSKLKKNIFADAFAMAIGLVACYTLGTVWFMVVTGTGLVQSLLLCVVPFIAGDLIKIALATVLVNRLGKHLKLN